MFRIKEILKDAIIDGKKGTTVLLAEKVGLPQPNMSNIVNNKAKPSWDNLTRIAEALNVEVWELFDRKSKTELTALVEHRSDFYKAETLEELKSIVNKIEQKKDAENAPDEA